MGGSKIRPSIVLFVKSTLGSANEREDGDFFVRQYFFQSFNHGDGRELKEGQTILVIGFNVPRADQT
jgi:hypothetical protein